MSFVTVLLWIGSLTIGEMHFAVQASTAQECAQAQLLIIMRMPTTVAVEYGPCAPALMTQEQPAEEVQ